MLLIVHFEYQASTQFTEVMEKKYSIPRRLHVKTTYGQKYYSLELNVLRVGGQIANNPIS